MPTFSLLDEPWLPVKRRDGTPVLVGLRSCLLQPTRFAGLDTTQPTEALALYRLLLAICHRAVGPGSLEARTRLLSAWPTQSIDEYLSRWAARFDLFGETPFLQVKALERTSLVPSPWTRLAFDRASGNTRVLFDHSLDDVAEPIVAGLAARLLISHLQFTPGGLVRAFRSSGTRGPACGLLCVMTIGDHLGETLALNLVPQAQAEYAADRALWESAEPPLALFECGAEVVPAGPVQRYVHLSRALLLRPTDGEHGPTVMSALYAEGLDVATTPRLDSMSAGRRVVGEMRPLLMSAERAFWRDLHALIADEASVPPPCIEAATAMRMQLGDFRPLELLAGGLLTDKAKLVLWRIEERRLAPRLLSAGSTVSARVRPAVALAENVANKLQGAFWILVKQWLAGIGQREPARADISALIEQLTGMPRYWAALEPNFWQFIDRLSGGQDPDAAFDLWTQDVRASLTAAWQVTTAQLGRDARALRAASLAGPALSRALAITQPDLTEA